MYLHLYYIVAKLIWSQTKTLWLCREKSKKAKLLLYTTAPQLPTIHFFIHFIQAWLRISDDSFVAELGM